MILEDYREKIDIERMYDELFFYHINPAYRSKPYARGILKDERFVTTLDEKTHMTFHTPDQVILFENWDGKNGVTTGIDLESAFEILNPYLRKKKIEKLKNKKI